MERTIKKYGNITLINIVSDEPMEWDISGATHVRVRLPPSPKSAVIMQHMGYQFVDRMLNVSVNLKKIDDNLKKAIRVKAVLEAGRREEILELAIKSFARDRRFHLEAEYNDEIAAQVIKGYMEEVPEFYISTNKGVLTGFLGLKESEEEKNAAIYLAAVDERYRISGAALSLYASALFDGAIKGFKNITGYISTANPSVINLYAYFGGVFSNPQDIYIKKIEGRK